jgi:protein-tyrosine phosphatase
MIDADEVYAGLWQGAQPPEGEELGRAGFSLLVLCASEYQPPAEAFPGVEVLHVPLEDASGLGSDIELLRLVRPVVLRTIMAVRSGRKALVTCHAGLNRSGLVTGLALRGLTGMPGAAVVYRLKRLRSLWALSNSQFRQIVLDSSQLRTYFEHGTQVQQEVIAPQPYRGGVFRPLR